MKELSPFEAFERVLRFWWVVALLAILGGGVGRLVSALRPPLYEAAAMVSVKVRVPDELVETIPYAEVNEIHRAVANELLSDRAWAALQSAAAARGWALPAARFDDRVFTLERLRSDWKLMVRDPDPQRAADLANLWVETAWPLVEEAYEHALAAERLRLERASVGACFENHDFAGGNACAGLSLRDPQELQAYLAQLDRAYQAELQASGRFSPWLSLALSTPAAPPAVPVRRLTGQLVFAGMALGLLAGLLVVQFLPPRRGG